jgi:hypothetical protein
MLPFVLRRIGADPASASAPFVATLVDVTGLVIYFADRHRDPVGHAAVARLDGFFVGVGPQRARQIEDGLVGRADQHRRADVRQAPRLDDLPAVTAKAPPSMRPTTPKPERIGTRAVSITRSGRWLTSISIRPRSQVRTRR